MTDTLIHQATTPAMTSSHQAMIATVATTVQQPAATRFTAPPKVPVPRSPS
jgi:hypothetical protein